MPLPAILASAGTSLMGMLGNPMVQKGITGFLGGLGPALPGITGGASSAAGRKVYNNVQVKNGRLYYPGPDGRMRMIGYTPRQAKKKFKTRRRRKRLTKRDMYIINAMQANPQASGQLGVMLG